jgi:hypothetical protein
MYLVMCVRYATLALDKGLLEDSIKVGLRLLVKRSSDARAKALLSQSLMVGEAREDQGACTGFIEYGFA